MVTARIAGLSPGTSPPPVRIPITPLLVLMRPLCGFLRACKRKIHGTDSMCKRHRSEPAGKFVTIYHKPLTMRERFAVVAAACSGSLDYGRRFPKVFTRADCVLLRSTRQ